jgi:hypothetical protein
MKVTRSRIAPFVIALVWAAGTAHAEHSLSVRADKEAYALGGQIEITAVLRNSSTAASWVDEPDERNYYVVELYGPGGNAVPKSAYYQRIQKGVTPGSGMTPFAAGATFETRIDLARLFDLPGPGVYTVQLSHLSIRSNALLLTVLPSTSATPAPAPSELLTGRARESP